MTFDYDIDFDPLKNVWLKEERGVCFDDIIPLFEERKWLALRRHPNQDKYPDQFLAVFELDKEFYIAPFVINHKNKRVFLKTLYPSRKARKQFSKKGKSDV